MMAGAQDGVAVAGDGPAAAAWRALAGGAQAPDSEHPIALWATARTKARASAGKAGGKDDPDDKSRAVGLFDAYRKAVQATPTHRRGPWAPISVLSGAAGPGVEADMAALVALDGSDGALPALQIHEWWHAASAMDAAFITGDDPSLSLEIDDRMALNHAFQDLRVRTLLWFAGEGDAPTEAADRLSELESKALEVPGFSRALPSVDADLKEIWDNLKHQAVLSYRLGPKAGDVVLLTPEHASIRPLEGVVAITAAARSHREAMLKAAGVKDAQVPPRFGNAVRTQILDPIQGQLKGLGRYLVIPDGPLWGFSIGSLPEQQLGRRFLADIRSISVGVTLSSVFREGTAAPQSYSPDFLGLTPKAPETRKGNIKIPTEVENAGRLFGSGLKNVKISGEATPEVFLDQAPTARYLHLSDVGVGDRGALGFNEGVIHLSDIRAMDLVCQVAVLSAEMGPALAVRRTQALTASGADALLFSTWLVPDQVRGKMLYSFYEARNRDRTAARALSEARQVLKDDASQNYFAPSWWGQYVLAGEP